MTEIVVTAEEIEKMINKCLDDPGYENNYYLKAVRDALGWVIGECDPPIES